jgi:glycine/D-amino acid oxidase-like deaminating enzyme
MATTRYGTPLWVEVQPSRRPAWPRLRGSARVDVVVVGGGLAGCTAAYVFAQAGVRVALVEAGRLASGATAAGPGVLDAGAGSRFVALRDGHGLRAARHMWDESRRASLELLALARRLRIRCGLARLDVAEIAVGATEATDLERERRALEAAGFDAVWLTGARARAATGLDAAAVLKRADAGWADPVRLAIGLARHAERRGAGVFESTLVRRIEPARTAVRVVAEHGELTAEAVVVATGRPEPRLAALHRHLDPVGTTIVALPPLPAPVRRAFGTGAVLARAGGTDGRAWRLDRDGSLVAWQAGQAPVPPRQVDAAAVQRTGQLMYELSLLYPAISGLLPTHGWTAGSFRSADGLVLAGPHRAFPRHLFVTGLGGDGLQGALLAARVNLRHYLGTPGRGDELFGLLRGRSVTKPFK